MSNLNFEIPTAIQEVAVPRILENDVVIAAETGSGKTLSYLLPGAEIVRRAEDELGRSLPKRPRAAIVTPSRELAMQVFEDAKALNREASSDSHFRSTHLLNPGTKKRRKNRDTRMREIGFDIVVGTPGSFGRCRDSGELYTSKLRLLVLDEADTLLTQGFDKELRSVTSGIEDSCRVVRSVVRVFIFTYVISHKNFRYLLELPMQVMYARPYRDTFRIVSSSGFRREDCTCYRAVQESTMWTSRIEVTRSTRVWWRLSRTS